MRIAELSHRFFLGGMKGQLGIPQLLMIFITIIFFIVALAPILGSQIDSYVGNSTDATTNTLVGLFLPMIALGIIASIIFYFLPNRGPEQG